jgi:hypothetical protein
MSELRLTERTGVAVTLKTYIRKVFLCLFPHLTSSTYELQVQGTSVAPEHTRWNTHTHDSMRLLWTRDRPVTRRIREVPSSNVHRNTSCSYWGFRCFPASSHVNSETVSKFCHDCFLPNHSQFHILQSTSNSSFNISLTIDIIVPDTDSLGK